MHVLLNAVYFSGRVDWKKETLVLDIFANKFSSGASGRKLADLIYYPSSNVCFLLELTTQCSVGLGWF